MSLTPLYTYSMNQETSLKVDGNANDPNRVIQNYPINYKVSFDINISDKIMTLFGSIFHVTSNDADYDFSQPTENSRNPGLWLYPNDTKLALGVGIPSKGQVVVSSGISLDIGTWYTVTIDVVDTLITMNTQNLNTGSIDKQTLTISPSDFRLRVIHKTSVVQISDKWYSSAIAKIRNFQLFGYINATPSNRPVIYQYATLETSITPYNPASKSIVFNYPKNYEISFRLKPIETSPSWQNILLVTTMETTSSYFGEGNNTRNPGIWFYPNSFRLCIPVGVPGLGQVLNDPIKPLEKNKYYNIRIIINELNMTLEIVSDDNSYNYNYTTVFPQFKDRTGHDLTYVYVGFPYEGLVAANATIQNVIIEAIGDYPHCTKTLTDAEAYCYNERYSDVKKLNLSVGQMKEHWSKIGCGKNRDPSCPSYQYIGCYNDNSSTHAIPNKKNNITRVEQCAVQAFESKNDLMGIQNSGECWTGNSIDSDYAMYGLGQTDNCGPLGGPFVNQVYQVGPPSSALSSASSSASPIKTYTLPTMSNKNFSSSIEGFSNDIPDLQSGNMQLYNQIFCDIYPSNNGFSTCTNCRFDGTNTVLSQQMKGSSQDCLNTCKNNNLCTSYSYDKLNKNKNCTLYNSFPTQIIENQQNIDSGYNLLFPYDYTKLTDAQKNTVRKKCTAQYLNNINKNTNLNIESCLDFKEYSNNITTVVTDKACIWNKLNAIGSANTVYEQTNNTNTNQMNSIRDPLLDTYKTKYENVKSAMEENKEVNNDMSIHDGDFSKYNQNKQSIRDQIEGGYNPSSSSATSNNQIQNIVIQSINQIGGKDNIESFENKKYIQFTVLMLLIILLFTLFVMCNYRKQLRFFKF